MLGLVEMLQPVTPYALKNFAAFTVVNFWSLPHTQIYTQCDRLTDEGYLSEQRETTGRRRRIISITDQGVRALEEWRQAPNPDAVEIRDTATLKLFFGADPKLLAPEQIEMHERKLADYLAIKKAGPIPGGPDAALESGIAFEQEIIEIWKAHLK